MYKYQDDFLEAFHSHKNNHVTIPLAETHGKAWLSPNSIH